MKRLAALAIIGVLSIPASASAHGRCPTSLHHHCPPPTTTQPPTTLPPTTAPPVTGHRATTTQPPETGTATSIVRVFVAVPTFTG